ncbi:IclR family transcriptional regulator [Terasakiella sp.]|uniref:IclR family transcriptional regulator n=1 Tax=Terasakiella sp. TaxID=2034861 RepID=UPI003AA9A9D5
MTDTEQTKDRKFVEALSRGLRILSAFDKMSGPLGNQDIASITGLPKPTVSRMTYTLTQLGYLVYSERNEKYELGATNLTLGHAYTANLRIRQIAKPHMLELAREFNVNIGLATNVQNEMIFVEYCRGDQLKSVLVDIGSKLPMGKSAIGRSYLAAIPEEKRNQILPQLADIHDKDWPDVENSIQDSLESYRTLGFTRSFGDWDRNINTVAVPLKLSENKIFCISCGGPSYVISTDTLLNVIGPRLIHVARDIMNSGL